MLGLQVQAEVGGRGCQRLKKLRHAGFWKLKIDTGHDIGPLIPKAKGGGGASGLMIETK